VLNLIHGAVLCTAFSFKSGAAISEGQADMAGIYQFSPNVSAVQQIVQ